MPAFKQVRPVALSVTISVRLLKFVKAVTLNKRG